MNLPPPKPPKTSAKVGYAEPPPKGYPPSVPHRGMVI